MYWWYKPSSFRKSWTFWLIPFCKFNRFHYDWENIPNVRIAISPLRTRKRCDGAMRARGWEAAGSQATNNTEGLVICECVRVHVNLKMYLDFRNASILKRGKISLLCPGKKEFVLFQNGSEWLDVLSPFCEMSLYFRPCFGYLWSFYHRKRCLSLLETTIECLRVWRFREFDL